MARPHSAFHTPGKRLRGDAWRIFWRDRSGVFEMSVGKISEGDAESCRLEVALALRTGKWPDWAATKPTVQRYLAGSSTAQGDNALTDYERVLRGEVSSGWTRSSLAMLRELEGHAGKPLLAVTARDAEAFLADVVRTPGPHLKKRKKPRSRSTRNRIRVVCHKFFGWAVRTGRARSNPFAGLRTLTEEDRGEIVHLSAAERDEVLAAAKGDPEGIAVWLALYAGLRRGEIAAATWKDVHLDRRKLDVPRTKTRRRRTVDLSAKLAAQLGKTPKGKRRGCVVPWPEDRGAWTYRSGIFLERIAGRLGEEFPREKLRWNVFRHTFASLLVQAGVSIFKVATWMGNDIAICQRHYAAMMPDHDPDIDRMK